MYTVAQTNNYLCVYIQCVDIYKLMLFKNMLHLLNNLNQYLSTYIYPPYTHLHSHVFLPGVVSLPKAVELVWIRRTHVIVKWSASLFPAQVQPIADYGLILSHGSHRRKVIRTSQFGTGLVYKHTFPILKQCTIYSLEISALDRTGSSLDSVMALFATKGGEETLLFANVTFTSCDYRPGIP